MMQRIFRVVVLVPPMPLPETPLFEEATVISMALEYATQMRAWRSGGGNEFRGSADRLCRVPWAAICERLNYASEPRTAQAQKLYDLARGGR